MIPFVTHPRQGRSRGQGMTEYLVIVAQWLSSFGANPEQIERARPAALVWALERGSRSGRVAQQFARDWAGRMGLAA